MTLVHALILGIVEGFTEFLPVSSTGHLILTGALLKLPQTEFLKTFDIAIQLGAILAVVAMNASRLLASRKALVRVVVAFIPTAILGLLFHDIIKVYLLDSPTLVLWSLLIGGIAIIAFEKWYKPAQNLQIEDLSWLAAGLIGASQAIAFVPGVSRAAVTIIAGLLLRLSRREAVEFSFLLAIPTMAAATGLDLLKSADQFAGNNLLLFGVGFLAAFVSAVVAIQWLLKFVQTHTFTGFGIYRILVALLGLFLIF